MSNIYIQEPPTHGKVLLVTSVGDIDIELWAKETPKACRNFCQLCMEGYYDGTIFHRVVKGFIAQGGDPTGTGTGGESIHGKPFKDEIHQRLRFVRRGLVAMANAGKDDNGSQFFFTFEAAPELQGKHTIFGKVTGDTIYNMLKLEGTLVDRDDKPVYPQKIINAKILSNPFDDIVPREKKKEAKKDSSKRVTKKGTKNFSLLSFGEEAEGDEEEVDAVTSTMRNKSKSSHDLIDDPSLSSVPAVQVDVKKRPRESDEDADDSNDATERNARMIVIRRRLSKDKTETSENKSAEVEDDLEFSDRKAKRLKERDSIRAEVNTLMKEMKKSSKKVEKLEAEASDSEPEFEEDNEMVRDYKEEKSKFKNIKKTQLKKGSERESLTLQILSKFQSKIHNVHDEKEISDPSENNDDDDSNFNNKWLNHELKFEAEGTMQARDASIKDAETFEIFDPRNPINQRRREKGKGKR